MIDNIIDADKYGVDYIIEGSIITWGAFVTSINELVVEMGYDNLGSEDKRLEAYFIKMKELSSDRFSEKVLKYLWDDAFKMDREKIFKSDFRALDEIIKTYETHADDKLEKVLVLEIYEKMVIETNNHNLKTTEE